MGGGSAMGDGSVLGGADYYCPGSLDSDVLLDIFIASVRAVGCAAALASAGLWMARRGLMTPGLSKGLSHISVKLAIPCLLFCAVVPGVSWRLLQTTWPLLALPAVYLSIGAALGGALVRLIQPPESFRFSTVAACAFGNTQGIPIILVSVLQQSLSRSVYSHTYIYIYIYIHTHAPSVSE
jgi:predicted permease